MPEKNVDLIGSFSRRVVGTFRQYTLPLPCEGGLSKPWRRNNFKLPCKFVRGKILTLTRTHWQKGKSHVFLKICESSLNTRKFLIMEYTDTGREPGSENDFRNGSGVSFPLRLLKKAKRDGRVERGAVRTIRVRNSWLRRVQMKKELRCEAIVIMSRKTGTGCEIKSTT